MLDLSVLNDKQREAVDSLEGPLLILAGAGSGKTRALTYRIANLIEHGVPAYQILALTFTNKAAKEMRERVSSLLEETETDMWVLTFHACCTRILRRDIDVLGRERSFVIYDDADQMSVIGDVIKKMGFSEKEIPKREIKTKISDAKNKSSDPEQYLMDSTFSDNTVLKIYHRYEKALLEANALDFDDLLLITRKLFSESPETLEKYRSRFRYVLVDEYQDTNGIQYELLELLCREHRNICVVGDDDQSIYGWRGADIRNILEFEKDFPGAKVIRLEQNYRSSANILLAANTVIGHNLARKPKQLWTQKEAGDCIWRYTASTEREEADYICKRILEAEREGASYADFAVLYRMNAQSRVLESMLVSYGIPYKVYGGQRFYERREIKDILAYLRLLQNPADNVAFLRVVNVPRRGIGDASINELTLAAQAQDVPLMLCAMTGEGLSDKLHKKLQPFVDTMTEFTAMLSTTPLSKFTEKMIAALDYRDYLKAEEKKGELESRMDNLRELIGNIEEIENAVGEEENALSVFLENVALIADVDGMPDDR
ncbi:MAG: UvrD-helicase domain-containing protein, partial [Eubacteriales bacterium]|nr:UvrD-helicase domain-containing protein [Eubacteriales bacterium]